MTWSLLVLAMAAALPSSANAQADVADTWVVVHAGALLAVPGEAPENEKTIVIRNDMIESVLDGYVPAAETGAVDAQVCIARGSVRSSRPDGLARTPQQ